MTNAYQSSMCVTGRAQLKLPLNNTKSNSSNIPNSYQQKIHEGKTPMKAAETAHLNKFDDLFCAPGFFLGDFDK